MRSKDLNTLEKFLKEYGMTPGSSTPVAQQQTGAKAKANSPTTTQKPSPSAQRKPSPSVSQAKPQDADTAQYVMRKTSELEVGTEFKDEKGKVKGIVTSPIGDGPNPDAVVVQDPQTKKYSVMQPDEVVNIDNPELAESKSTDLIDRLKRRTAKTKRKIKHLLRAQKYKTQGDPVFEINFNSRDVAKNALNAKIQCGFEAETAWPNLHAGSDEDDTDWLDNLYWNRVSDLIHDQEGSSSLERVEEGYREWLLENIVFEFESEIVGELVAERKEDEAYIDDFVDNQVSSDEVEDYKEEKLEDLKGSGAESEFEEYSDWDMDAWAREYVEIYRQDDFIEWIEEQIRENGEAWDDAWERAMYQYDMDDWCRREHSGSWYSLLSDYDIYLYNEDSGGGVDEVASLLEDWASNNSQSNDVRPGGYHSGQGVNNTYWRVEDDSSIEGDGAKAEIISPVYDSPAEMLKEMKSLFEFMENNDAETNSSTGLHVTMSWMEKDWVITNKLKIAVLLGDKYVLKQFGRERNTYTRSQQENLQQYIQNLQNDINDEKSLAGLEDILLGGISDGKFSSINFKDARNDEQNNLIEFRVAGGDDYHTMTDDVMKAVIRYAAVMQAGHNEEAYRKDYVKALFKMIAGKDTVSGDVVKRAQSMVDPDSINDKVLSAFQSIASKKHYTDAIEALSNAYMQLADVQKMRDADPQSELQFEDEEETTDWRREMIKAQKYFVRAFAMLVTDVATGANRAPIRAAQISALRQATKQFGFNVPKLWQEIQQSEFYKNFKGTDVHTKSEKFASAVNSLLAKQDAKAQEAVFTVNFDRDKHRMFMPSNIASAVYNKSSPAFSRSDDNPNAQLPDKFTPDMFTVVPESEYENVRIARSEYEKNMSKIENDMEIIDGFKARLKNTDPADKEIDAYKFSIQKRTDFVKKAQASALEDKKIMDQFAKKYGFVPATPSYGSEPLGKSMTLTNTDALEWISQNHNIKFGTNESVFAKFDSMPLQEKLNLLSKIDTNKLNEAWSKKYKSSINCNNPKGFSQKAHCAGKKKTEAVLGPNPTSTSLPGYIKAINDILQSNSPVLKMGASGAHTFTANPGQSVTSTSDIITGQGKDHSGKDTEQVIAKTLWKGQLKTTTDSPTAKKVVFNRGEVAEAYHALAAFVRFIARPTRDITLEDVVKWIPKLENGVTYDLKVTDAENKDLADEFWVTVSLKPEQWTAFKDPNAVLADTAFAKIARDIVDDANSETGRRADVYATNGRYDLVRVIGDGVSGETETKTDIEFENETEKKYRGYSIKVGSVKQIHQVGGGAISGGRKASAEERFSILQDELFGVHGRFRIADISDAKVAYLKAAQDESVKGRLAAQEIGYKAAVESINNFIKTDDDEKKYVKLLAKAFKFFQARDDDRILLKQFTGTKKGTYILDPKRFDKLHQQGLNLVAVYDEAKENPEMAIIDQDSNKRLVTFRTYKTADGYMRNYIEKGDLWKDLTNIANVKESVREGAVPDNSTVRTLREILSKPLLSGDLKGQMIAYTAVPDPSMIRDFRSARAMAGDQHDLRDVLRSYIKAKLHPDVMRKIK